MPGGHRRFAAAVGMPFRFGSFPASVRSERPHSDIRAEPRRLVRAQRGSVPARQADS
jgi:hypothetical protein